MKARWLVLSVITIGSFGPAARAQQASSALDTTTFIVMGEGFAAGMANYGLSSTYQNFSFPAQAAAQIRTAFPQPLIQPPGIGDVVGYSTQEVRLQTYPQGSVRQFYTVPDTLATSPPLFVFNLSVPGLTLQDAVSIKPSLPIAQRDMKQTEINLILGFPSLFLNNVPLWTQFDYARAMFPTMAMIELGYTEALNAAVRLDPAQLPDSNAFGATYGNIISGLRALQTQVIATTIPNPLDTAYFSNRNTASAILYLDPSVLPQYYPQIGPNDYLTRNALMTISNQLEAGPLGTLPDGSVLTAAAAQKLTDGINALNAQIVNVAKANGAVVYDLNAFLHKVKTSGASAGGTALSADYLGGFYSLDAVYPSPTGNALIANDFLSFLNSVYKTSFQPVSVSTVAAKDAIMLQIPPKGHLRTTETLRQIPDRRISIEMLRKERP